MTIRTFARRIVALIWGRRPEPEPTQLLEAQILREAHERADDIRPLKDFKFQPEFVRGLSGTVERRRAQSEMG